MNALFVEQSIPSEQAVSSRSRHGFRILAGSIALGLLGNFLFRGQSPGLNVFLWTASLVAAAASISVLSGLKFEPGRNRILAGLLGFSILLAWRDSPTLNGLAMAALFFLASVAVAWETREVWSSSIRRLGALILGLVGEALKGFLLLVRRDIDWTHAGENLVWKRLGAGLTGILVAIPFAIVFAALFTSADEIYKRHLLTILDFNRAEVITAILWTVAFAWGSAGYLRKLFLPAHNSPAPPLIQNHTLGAIETSVALAVINLLFLSFVAVQVRYLFGGADVVLLTPELGFAEYARRGFFELVAASALVLPLLLVADWLYPREARKTVLRILSSILIVLLFVIMASAAKRMKMYQAEYGLTELRFYVSAFMIMLVAIFLWFGVTVLRGQRNRFLGGAVAIGLLAIVGLHVANPDRWIMKVNLERAAAGKSFDVKHALSLSADAAPLFASDLKVLPADQQVVLIEGLERLQHAPTDLRSWNYGRWQAKKE